MERIEKRAYAKINLSLDVTGRLENGYHLVKMIMQTVGIYDTLEFERTDGEISITADGGELPLGPDNLIHKAILLMKDTYGIDGGARVHLVKRIPIAAGMAGGSTDAACALKAMNELYELGLSERELMEIGVKIGADVPYCVMGGTALAEGIGEKLKRLPDMPKACILVVKPNAFVSTKEVYQKLDGRLAYGCPATEGAAEPESAASQKASGIHPDVDGMVRAIQGADLEGIVSRLGNVLELVTLDMVPEIRRIKERMLAGGARGSLMSGSGPSVFGIFENEEKAQAVLEELKAEGLAYQGFVTGPEFSA